MAKRYDVIVVGAGPAGFTAAKAAGENGFEVALLERKTDLTVMDRACGQTLDSANEYFHQDLYICNIRNNRLSFPAHGFSVKYDGPLRNAYAWHIYSPNGNRIQAGICEEQKKKGDYGKVTVIIDKEILFRCLIEEVEACSVNIFPGINIEKVTNIDDGLRVEGSGQSFEGTYVIAADGVNSRVAQTMGMNEGRNYFTQLRSITRYLSNVDLPDPDACVSAFGFVKEGSIWLFTFPRSADGEYINIVLTIDPRVDLEVAENHFTKEAFCAPWFKNAKILRTFSADENCYTPIVQTYKNHVLVVGDACASQELEITGAMIHGWKAGNAISTALQEEKLGLEVTAIDQFVKWWKEVYVDHYGLNAFMRGWAMPLFLNKPDEIDYLFSLIKEPFPPCFNPASMRGYMRQAQQQSMPTIQKERPEIAQKMGKLASLPNTELYTEITKLSKPIL